MGSEVFVYNSYGHRTTSYFGFRRRSESKQYGDSREIVRNHRVSADLKWKSCGARAMTVYEALLVCLGGYIYEAHFECHDILMLGKKSHKIEATSRHDHCCVLGRKASLQTNKQTNKLINKQTNI